MPAADYFKSLPNPFEKRLRVQATEKRAEAESTEKLEHIKYVKDLSNWLEARGHKEACVHLRRSREDRCDPWKYEPILLEELYKLKASRGTDRTELNEIRKLIRAGSWTTYERLSDRDAVSKLGSVREREQADWLWKIRNADPDTAKEHAENRDQLLADIDRIERELYAGKIGESLENTTTSVESLMAGAWHELKKAIAMHGLTWDDVKKHPATKGLFEEIEALRPVRDLAYYRRLYPHQARAAK